MLERVSIACSLASAFKYLHYHRLIYRDIKPENIGFDSKGIVKIFDFGLCKELRPKDLDSSNETKKTLASSFERRYKLTEFVGTIPYMSPEVFFGKPYNCFVDVYSFGMLLYEIVYLTPQF